MCNFGGDDQTKATTSQQYSPRGFPTFQDIIGRAGQVSNLPYKPIQRNIAGLTGAQRGAMRMLGGNPWQKFAAPFMNQAADLFQSASQPLTGADVEQYYNPMSDAVMANLQEIFGAQRRDITGGLTGAAGGVGADRIAVGQAETARQQGLAGGQTMAGLWQNALNAAQAQQGIEQASAYGLGNLGATSLGSALSAAGAKFNMGAQQQATQQAGMDARFARQMAQRAYPFQTAQWYAGMALPAAGAMGATTTGQQTVDPADPNFWSQLAGAGLTGAAMFAKSGGRIKGYAVGGSPYGDSLGAQASYVPSIPITPPTATMQPLEFMSAPKSDGMGGVGGKGSNVYKDAGQGLQNMFGGNDESAMGWETSTTPTFAGMGNYLGLADGGRVEEDGPYEVLSRIARGKGGQIKKMGGGAFGAVKMAMPFVNAMDEEYPGIAGALGFRPIWDQVRNPSPYSPLGLIGGMMNRGEGEKKEGDAHTTKAMFGLSPMWELMRSGGGQIEGYADGGSPFGNSALSASPEEVQARLAAMGIGQVPGPIPPPPQLPGKATDRLDPTLAPELAARITPQSVHPKSSPDEYSVWDVPQQGGPPVPGFAEASMTEGAAPSPFVPKTGFDGAGNPVTQPPPLLSDPNWRAQAEKAPIVPHEVGPEGQVTPDTTGVTLPPTDVEDRGVIAPMQAQGPLQSTGEGRWAQVFASQLPAMFERPTLFGRPLTNSRLGLMAAGLGMLGGESPYFGVNVGQGGLQGIKTIHDFQQLDAQRQAMALNRLLEAGRLDAQEGAYRVTAADKLADNLRQLDFAVRAGFMDPKDAQKIASEMTKSYKESGMVGQDVAIPDYAGQGKVDIDSFPEPIYSENVNPKFAIDIDASLEGIEDTDRFTRGLQTSKGAETAAAESKEILKGASEASTGAKEVIGTAYETNRYLDKLPQDGFLTPGTGFDTRVGIARAANTIARATSLYGDQTEYTLEQATKDIGTAEAIQKLQTYAGFGLARTLGTREALQVIQQALAAVAGGHMTPAGAKNIIYSVIAAQSRHPDRHRFLQGFGRRSRYNNVLGADEFFDKVAPIEKYSSRLELLKRFDAARRKATPEQLEALKKESWDVYRVKPEMWGGF